MNQTARAIIIVFFLLLLLVAGGVYLWRAWLLDPLFALSAIGVMAASTMSKAVFDD